MKTPRSDKAWKAYKHSGNAQHIRSESCRLEAELDAAKAKLEKCREAFEIAIDELKSYGWSERDDFYKKALDQTK